MIGRSVLPLLLLLALGAGGVEARQAAPPELVDRVVAVVGDSVVLMSQVEEETQRLTLRGIAVPTEPQALASLRSDLLNAMVNQLLIIQEALRDSTLTVDDAELEQIAADQISQQVRRAGTQAALTQQLAQQGFSLTAYREFIKSEVRRERLQQMYLQKAQAMGSNVMVDEEEVRAAWEEQRAQIPPFPPVSLPTRWWWSPSLRIRPGPPPGRRPRPSWTRSGRGRISRPWPGASPRIRVRPSREETWVGSAGG
jgi:hypothetical protein